MRTDGYRSILPMIALAGAAASTLALPGPLNPPAGPIASTQKPLGEVEPRTAINATNTPGDGDSLLHISQPGSYYLTGNVTGVSGKSGIEIGASNVTVDLCGFAVIGVPGSLDGVTIDSVRSDIIVRNGTISAWGSDGINLTTGGPGSNCLIEGITASSNGGTGIFATANFVVRDCAARLNGLGGFSGTTNGVFSGCTARDNTGPGFLMGSGCAVSGCSARANTADGFLLGAACTAVNCAALSNTGNGFTTGSSCTISACVGVSNGVDGFSCNPGSAIIDCTAQNNAHDGVHVFTGCSAQGCTCGGNGVPDGAGIHVSGVDCRIERNTCTGNIRGVDVDAAGNIIVRNTCSGNTTNWDIVAGNVCLVVNATTAAAITGNSGGTGPGSTDPSANFTY